MCLSRTKRVVSTPCRDLVIKIARSESGLRIEGNYVIGNSMRRAISGIVESQQATGTSEEEIRIESRWSTVMAGTPGHRQHTVVAAGSQDESERCRGWRKKPVIIYLEGNTSTMGHDARLGNAIAANKSERQGRAFVSFFAQQMADGDRLAQRAQRV